MQSIVEEMFSVFKCIPKIAYVLRYNYRVAGKFDGNIIYDEMPPDYILKI